MHNSDKLTELQFDQRTLATHVAIVKDPTVGKAQKEYALRVVCRLEDKLGVTAMGNYNGGA